MTDEVPWLPESLREWVGEASELRGRWRYVVLEELVGATGLLLRWPWPLVDEKGRLFWPLKEQEQVADAGVPLSLLEQQLYEPSGLRRRPRIGDTFAVRQSGRGGWGRRGIVRDIRKLFPDLVLDVSADAREAANLAYYGALGAPHSIEEDDQQLLEAATVERENLSAVPIQMRPPGEGSEHSARPGRRS